IRMNLARPPHDLPHTLDVGHIDATGTSISQPAGKVDSRLMRCPRREGRRIWMATLSLHHPEAVRLERSAPGPWLETGRVQAWNMRVRISTDPRTRYAFHIPARPPLRCNSPAAGLVPCGSARRGC